MATKTDEKPAKGCKIRYDGEIHFLYYSKSGNPFVIVDGKREVNLRTDEGHFERAQDGDKDGVEWNFSVV